MGWGNVDDDGVAGVADMDSDGRVLLEWDRYFWAGM